MDGLTGGRNLQSVAIVQKKQSTNGPYFQQEIISRELKLKKPTREESFRDASHGSCTK
jgi:hypothetical protein